ncbi:alpha/beta hydrolase-fold protein [Pseudomarimonas salicorniae]|uniref:Polyhydroxybutyrate depolymerase n=1 Tax=Pseudomarimonas salicorniae TaxID=2933270 RepID=A0ABT0GHB2_9GAMM|nr:alpha/beta hydrolase-fold protein [Lysobacter sp. CAU 1642]MCK7593732.1 hypothetical protein [Lysobacter sp. CAU 1642]
MARLDRLLAVLITLVPTVALASGEWWRFEIDGESRRALVHPPRSLAEEPPTLVVVYHGRGDDAAAFARAVALHEDWPEALVIYPRGEVHAGRPVRGWQYRAGQYADRDLKLTDALLARAAERYGSRSEDSLAAGFSNGGHFVFLLMAERPEAFAAHAVIGSVRPEFALERAPRPLLYLFGRSEPRRYQDDWRATVEALSRHQRGAGGLFDWSGCCKRQAPAAGGAEFIFGLYPAGHIWPEEGNAWLRAFAGRVLAPAAATGSGEAVQQHGEGQH